MKSAFWRGKRVFITGHTGFKGGWLTLWLSELGAEVHGFSLPPPTDPSFFVACGLESRVSGHVIGDIRDYPAVSRAMRDAEPDLVFHLAAQPLVRYGYASPVETYAVNVMGTAHVLEAARHTPSVRSMVVVTSDKCYENQEWLWPYRETDAMGGYDPYSSSKACAELLTAAYRRSFLQTAQISVATARAGNVIGGGDWAPDRLVPDFLRAMATQTALTIRSPNATRPWQHVLEPLSGYILLAERLYEAGVSFADAWNFGPDDRDVRTVRWIAEYLSTQAPGATWNHDASGQPHEANALRLDSSKSKTRLGWHPRWSLEVALDKTLSWHRAWHQGEDLMLCGVQQISEYEAVAN